MRSVLVLMSTFNGEKYILEQLESIKGQKNVNIDLIIRDDGSNDNTTNLIESFIVENKTTKIKLIKSENIGFVKSFFKLAQIAYSSDKKYDFYAFSDQDDYWLENKIDAATSALEVKNQSIPLLYFCQPQKADESLNYLPSEVLSIFKSFAESLIYNCATGCTEVFNFSLLEIVIENLYKIPSIHDSYFYQVCLAVGGDVVFDRRSYILYRQHSNNVIGGNEKFLKQWKRRYNQIFYNRGNERSKNVELLYFNIGDKISANNIHLVKLVVNYKKNLLNRFKLLINKEFRSKSFAHNFNFFISVLIKMY